MRLLAAVDRHGPVFLALALAVASGLVFSIYLGSGPTRFHPPTWLEAVNRLAGAPACWWLTRFMVRGRFSEPVRWLQAYSFPIFTMHAMLMAVPWTAYNATHQPPGSMVFWIYWLVTAPFGAAAPVLIARVAERVAPRPWALLLGLPPPEATQGMVPGPS